MNHILRSRNVSNVIFCLGSVRRNSRNIMKLKDRGLYQDIFPDKCVQEIIDLCNCSPQCVYAGFDPTAKSLHIGNLLVLTGLIHWQRGGHQVIALVGGATAQIGDPSGKSKERDQQNIDILNENAKHLSENMQKIFSNHEVNFWKNNRKLPEIKILNNYAWYSGMNCIDFIRGIGKNLRVGRMLSRSCVSTRLNSEAGISFSEFSYQLFQAYDWLYLLRNYNCRFQIGGNDQMGNILSGHELISRLADKSVYGLTLPLLSTDSGDKFGKSAHNAVWLDPEMTSPFEFYQYFFRTPDHELSKLLKLFTFRTPASIDDLLEKHMKCPEKHEGQRILAEEVTLLVHGAEGLDVAKKATAALYNNDVQSLSELRHETIEAVFKGATQVSLLLQPGITVKQLALSAKCFVDQRDADRIIPAGGFYINLKRSTNPNEVLVNGVHILPNQTSLLRVGKKNYWIVKWLV